jgi:DNA repair exonuclease SbcCD ATPase subunit
MFSKANCLWTILITIFLHIPRSFSGEVYRWTDDKGTIHLTDDVSKIPERYGDQAEKIEVQEETLKEVEKIGKQEEGSDRVKDYLENLEKKIEMKKSMERKISEFEEELRSSEERLKKIEEYEREDYLYYQPFKDPKTGKWVPVVSPFYKEKRRLKAKIEATQAEIKSIQEKLLKLMRSL